VKAWQRTLLACLLAWLTMHAPTRAHEMGTAALVLHELTPGQGLLVFKRSVGADGGVAPIDFSFQPACALSESNVQWEGEREVIQRARFGCASALSNHAIEATGFTRLAPDLIVHITTFNGHGTGTPQTTVLSPASPTLRLNQVERPTSVQPYFGLGIEHIVLGPDHVLFVCGLFLLWMKRKQSKRALLGQFTLFTLGHSLTLALLVLGLVAVPTQAIEAWIALSVLWLAYELTKPEQVGARPKQKALLGQCALISLFGLLHGSGFALSMQSKGFPQDDLALALLLFNLGIEVGQLLVVALLASVFWLLARLDNPTHRINTRHALTILMGGAALYWTFDRIIQYV
jgi:hypothetical protein